MEDFNPDDEPKEPKREEEEESDLVGHEVSLHKCVVLRFISTIFFSHLPLFFFPIWLIQ